MGIKALGNPQLPFWLLAITVIIGLTLPVLIQDGMFMDAMLYTSVSKNMAIGKGSFWFPYFSKFGVGGLPTFHEQPPLVFGIQALFFKLLGTSLYTERIYVLCITFLSVWLINQIWKSIFPESAENKIGWLPVSLWIIIPVCFWSYANNMHENTMGVFVLLSVWAYWKAQKGYFVSYPYLVLSSVFIMLASLSKGIPGLFPVVMPFLYGITMGKIRFKGIVFETVLLVGVIAGIYGLLLCFPESNGSLTNYFVKRAMHRIEVEPTVDSRFYVLYRLLTELGPSFALTAVIYGILRWKKQEKTENITIKTAAFFILLGFSGSLPLMLTMVQKVFYFVHALPYFALGFGVLIAKPLAETVQKRISVALLPYLSTGMFVVLLLVSFWAMSFREKIGREKEIIQDVYTIGAIIKGDSIVSVSPPLWDDWHLQTYLVRYYDTSVDPVSLQKYWIGEKAHPEAIPPNYEQIPLNTSRYTLYRRKP